MMPTRGFKQTIPIAEAAVELGIQLEQAKRLASMGVLKAKHRDGQLLVSRTSVDRAKADPSPRWARDG